MGPVSFAGQRRRPRVRAMLIDVLGTLVMLEPPVAPLRAELADRFGVRLTESQAAAALVAEIAYYRRHLDEGRDPERLRELRRRCAEVMRSALPPSPRLQAVSSDELTQALLSSLHFSAYADAAPALRTARARGLTIVAVSNWDVSLHEVLARLSLAELLDAVVTSAEIGARKPDPEIFRRALALVGARGPDAVHVGDSLEEDVAGARAAGIRPILLARKEPVMLARGQRPPAAGTRVISSLLELAAEA